MAKVTLQLTLLNPQPTLVAAGTPQQLASVESLYLHIQAPPGNTGNVYIADSSANILAGNCHILGPGESMQIGTDDSAADEDKVILDSSDLWFDGSSTGDKLVVAYLNFKSISYTNA